MPVLSSRTMSRLVQQLQDLCHAPWLELIHTANYPLNSLVKAWSCQWCIPYDTYRSCRTGIRYFRFQFCYQCCRSRKRRYGVIHSSQKRTHRRLTSYLSIFILNRFEKIWDSYHRLIDSNILCFFVKDRLVGKYTLSDVHLSIGQEKLFEQYDII